MKPRKGNDTNSRKLDAADAVGLDYSLAVGRPEMSRVVIGTTGDNIKLGMCLTEHNIILRFDDVELIPAIQQSLKDFGFKKQQSSVCREGEWVRRNDAVGRVLAREILSLTERFGRRR